MATFTRVKTKAGEVRWKAQVCVGRRRPSRRFPTRAEAAQWAFETEAALERHGDLITGMSLGDALLRYAEELPPGRKGLRQDQIRLARVARTPLAAEPLQTLGLLAAEQHISAEQATGKKNSSITRDFAIIKPALRAAVKWRWLDRYPWDGLRMPKAEPRRSKLYTSEEIEAICQQAKLTDTSLIENSTQETALAFRFACATAMRLGEVCAIESSWWNRELNTVALPASVTKTNTARIVPLSSAARACLHRLTPSAYDDRLFYIKPGTASTLFRKLRRAVGIHDGTFHDSRHYAVTHLAKKLEVLELARVTGHSNIDELLTYYELDAAGLADKLG